MTRTTITTTEKLTSTITEDDQLILEIQKVPVPSPGPDEVVIAVEATPINPSDMMMLWPGMDLTAAHFHHKVGNAGVVARVVGSYPRAIPGPLHTRLNRPVTPGLEGAGTVIAAGSNAEHLIGHRVAATAFHGGMFARHCTVKAANCVVLPPHLSARDGASFFTNPLTAVAMLETLRLAGQRALIHTAAASSLGLMLARACLKEGIELVAVVRRDEQEALLRDLGVQHVCRSDTSTFMNDLVRAAAATGAMMAFDAIGGSDMPHQLLAAMTTAHTPAPGERPYGLRAVKKVMVYGRLDHTPPRLNPSEYGGVWALEGWAMPTVLEAVGEQRSAQLQQRVLEELDSTFVTQYRQSITLPDLLDQEVLARCFRQQTGGKYLIEP